jgi:lipopolysaccharide transport system ATP-binding protein
MTEEKIAIRVKGLGKRYRLGGPRERYHTFRDAIVNSLKAPFNRLQHTRTNDFFWALKNVSFNVGQGEVVGIIGRNGAGKSTLLKILSRITTPSEGFVELHGRVGSLLEVGTGFHPELTGRENIYLSGSILGMKHREIDAKLDEIVKFSEIEKFLDTPVKRFSSGMYVRLAFAVAAHLEPEILLVDEVLAVGDIAFQKKCLGKMGNIAKEGRTVLFVSHNMTAVQSLSKSAILFDQGHIIFKGNVNEVIEHYLSNALAQHIQSIPGEFDLSKRINQFNNGKPIIQRVLLLDKNFQRRDTFLTGEILRIVIEVEGLSAFSGSEIGVAFKTMYDQRVGNSSTWMVKRNIQEPRKFREWAILTIPRLPFTPGRWSIYLSSTIHTAGIYLDKIENSVYFDIEGADVFGTGQLITKDYGLIYLESEWKIKSDFNEIKE